MPEGLKRSDQGKTGSFSILPHCSIEENSDSPSASVYFEAVEKRASRGFRNSDLVYYMCVRKSFSKKFRQFWPSIEGIATTFAESKPSLSSLMARAGIINGVYLSTGAATDKRMKPVSPPLNIPVYGWLPRLTHCICATLP